MLKVLAVGKTTICTQHSPELSLTDWMSIQLHGFFTWILVDATMNRTISPHLWNAFAASAFTDEDKRP